MFVPKAGMIFFWSKAPKKKGPHISSPVFCERVLSGVYCVFHYVLSLPSSGGDVGILTCEDLEPYGLCGGRCAEGAGIKSVALLLCVCPHFIFALVAWLSYVFFVRSLFLHRSRGIL